MPIDEDTALYADEPFTEWSSQITDFEWTGSDTAELTFRIERIGDIGSMPLLYHKLRAGPGEVYYEDMVTDIRSAEETVALEGLEGDELIDFLVKFDDDDVTSSPDMTPNVDLLNFPRPLSEDDLEVSCDHPDEVTVGDDMVVTIEVTNTGSGEGVIEVGAEFAGASDSLAEAIEPEGEVTAEFTFVADEPGEFDVTSMVEVE